MNTAPGKRYSQLKELGEHSSEERRAILRRATEALGQSRPSQGEMAELDGLLSSVASEYSLEVRVQLARLIAASASGFQQTAESFAMDDIRVAAPVLGQSPGLSDDVLLRVVARKSQPHMLAMTQRNAISARVSHALAEHGDDTVVSALLANARAEIGEDTFETVARRAETSPRLHAPLVGRRDVPLDILHALYHRVEKQLRAEIVQKFGQVEPAELEKAFAKSRTRLTRAYHRPPDDYPAAQQRITGMENRRELVPGKLVTLLREGPAGRTAFKLAFARLADIEFDVADRVVEDVDLDSLALLSRGAGLDRALFVTLAIGLDKSQTGLANAESFGRLYEDVPVQAAQRALRFWKVRATGV